MLFQTKAKITIEATFLNQTSDTDLAKKNLSKVLNRAVDCLRESVEDDNTALCLAVAPYTHLNDDAIDSFATIEIDSPSYSSLDHESYGFDPEDSDDDDEDDDSDQPETIAQDNEPSPPKKV